VKKGGNSTEDFRISVIREIQNRCYTMEDDTLLMVPICGRITLSTNQERKIESMEGTWFQDDRG